MSFPKKFSEIYRQHWSRADEILLSSYVGVGNKLDEINIPRIKWKKLYDEMICNQTIFILVKNCPRLQNTEIK